MGWKNDNTITAFVPLIVNMELRQLTASVGPCLRMWAFSTVPTEYKHIKFKSFKYKLRLEII